MDDEYRRRDTSLVDIVPEGEKIGKQRVQSYRLSANEKFENDKVYYEMVCFLNEKQYHLHNYIYAWCIEERLKIIIQHETEPFYLFLSGGAGVGKSHVVNIIYQSAIRALRKPGIDTEKVTVLLMATTGKAASNIDGITLHSAFNLPVKERGQSWGFTSRSTARVILGQVLRIATCGTRTHRGDSL